MGVVVHLNNRRKVFQPPAGLGTPAGTYLYQRGLRVESTAKQLCPVDTGRLRSSIRTTTPYKRGRNLVVTVGTNVEYASYVENGTRNRDGSVRMRARPYLRPALEREMQR